MLEAKACGHMLVIQLPPPTPAAAAETTAAGCGTATQQPIHAIHARPALTMHGSGGVRFTAFTLSLIDIRPDCSPRTSPAAQDPRAQRAAGCRRACGTPRPPAPCRNDSGLGLWATHTEHSRKVGRKLSWSWSGCARLESPRAQLTWRDAQQLGSAPPEPLPKDPLPRSPVLPTGPAGFPPAPARPPPSHLDLFKVRQHIELGEVQMCEAVDPAERGKGERVGGCGGKCCITA